jgi:hypothetical protein
MEWLWRGMTYGKFPSMTKDEPALLPATVIAMAAATGESPATVTDSGKAV